MMMGKPRNIKIYLSGRNEVIFLAVLFLMDVFLDNKSLTRREMNKAIYYFRDRGLPLADWLFNLVLARWDTRLAWGTPARFISFDMDEHHQPDRAEPAVCRARRQAIWVRMREAIGRASVLPEVGWDLPSGNALLATMRDVMGDELLDRLTKRTKLEPQLTRTNDPMQRDEVKNPFQATFDRLKEDAGIEVGF